MQRYAVIGLGRFGWYLACALTDGGDEVIAIDHDAVPVDKIRDRVDVSVCLDSTDIDALRAQGVEAVDAAIVCIGEKFEASALTVVGLREIGVKRIIARAMTDTQATILAKVGADQIASAEQESAYRWAQRLALPTIEQYVELEDGHSLVYLPAPPSLHDRTLQEIGFRREFGVNVISIRRQVRGKSTGGVTPTVSQTISVPRPDTKILADDVLVLVGSDKNLARLRQA